MKRKILILLLVLCFVVSIYPFTALALSRGVEESEFIFMGWNDAPSFGWEPVRGFTIIDLPSGINSVIYPMQDSDVYMSGDFVGDELYMVNNTSPAELYRVNPLTGGRDLIGNTSVAGVTGFSYDVTTELAYLSTENFLYIVNLEDASVQLVGSFEPGLRITSIAINSYGIMYGIDAVSDTLVMIIKDYGICIPVGSLEMDVDPSLPQDICFDRNDDTLYGVLPRMQDNIFDHTFCQINVATGVANVIQSGYGLISAYTIPYANLVEFRNGRTIINRLYVETSEEVDKPDIPENPGFEFVGWREIFPVMDKVYQPNEPIYVEEFTVFDAIWDLQDYSINYEGNGNTSGGAPLDDRVYHMNDTAFAYRNTFIKDGYRFTGWKNDADGSLYNPGDVIVIGTQDITLTAQWELAQFNIYYESNFYYDGVGLGSGTAPVDNESYYMGEEAIVADNTGSLEKEGFYWAGWNTAWDYTGTFYKPGDVIEIESRPIFLYAQWATFKPHVYYDGNGESEGTVPVDPTEYKMGEEASVSENTGNLGKTGYHFTGWNTAADGSGEAYLPAESLPVWDQDITLYAQWEKIKYKVDYDVNGATAGTAPVDVNEYHMGDTVTVYDNIGNLEKPGSYFMGWKTTEDGTGLLYEAGDKFAVETQDVTLYAQWGLTEYNIYYDGNGNTQGTLPIDTSPYYIGDEVTVLDNAGSMTKTRFHFGGWNTAEDGSGKTYLPGSACVMEVEGVILYALWIKDPVTITYLEKTDDSPVGIANLEGNILLSEMNDEDTIAITVYLQTKKVTLEGTFEAVVEEHLKKLGYTLLEVYDLQLMKKVEKADGTITQIPINNDEITGPLNIRMPLTEEQAQVENLAIAYIDKEGNAVILAGGIVELEGDRYIEFQTDHFSSYALTEMDWVVNPKTGVEDDMSEVPFESVLIVALLLLIVNLATKKRRKS